ncbi:MAG: 2-oxo acid dehydrogenase subunit E2, partial [Gemmatimonadales bacterium]
MATLGSSPGQRIVRSAEKRVNFLGRTGIRRRGMGRPDPTALVERKSVHLNVFETANAGFAQAIYEDYLRDPASVAPEWRRLFDSGTVGERPAPGTPSTNGAPQTPAAATRSAPSGATELKGAAGRLVQNMNESLRIPTATSFRELNVTTLDARRREINATLAGSGKPSKLSFTHLVAWALVQGLKRHPMMGDSLLEEDGTSFRIAPDGINLGLAVDVQRKDGSRGLVVPVLKHAETMDFGAFHTAYEALVEKSRTNKLLPDAFQGATVTLTNPGGLGTSASVPRLMAHHGTIIATGAIGYPAAFAATPPDQLKALKVGKVMAMTSTYDHRIIQGAESGEFLRSVESLLQGADGFFEGVAQGLGVTLGAAPAAAAPLPTTKAGPLVEAPVSG